MGFIFGKDKKEKQERDRLFNRVKAGAEANDIGVVSATLLDIDAKGLSKDPEMGFLLVGAMTALAKKDVQDALWLGIWALGYVKEPELKKSVSLKTLTLIERVNRADMKQVASIAMAAGAVTEHSTPGSDEFKAGRRAWLAALDTLSAKKEGLGFAFAAASNAAVGFNREMPLRKDALEQWEKIVLDLSKSDKVAAEDEARRVAGNYETFGGGGVEFRARAHNVLGQLRNRP